MSTCPTCGNAHLAPGQPPRCPSCDPVAGDVYELIRRAQDQHHRALLAYQAQPTDATALALDQAEIALQRAMISLQIQALYQQSPQTIDPWRAAELSRRLTALRAAAAEGCTSVFVCEGTEIGIVCLICGLTSYHPRDISENFCGNCGRYHQHPGQRRRLTAMLDRLAQDANPPICVPRQHQLWRDVHLIDLAQPSSYRATALCGTTSTSWADAPPIEAGTPIADLPPHCRICWSLPHRLAPRQPLDVLSPIDRLTAWAAEYEWPALDRAFALALLSEAAGAYPPTAADIQQLLERDYTAHAAEYIGEHVLRRLQAQIEQLYQVQPAPTEASAAQTLALVAQAIDASARRSRPVLDILADVCQIVDRALAVHGGRQRVYFDGQHTAVATLFAIQAVYVQASGPAQTQPLAPGHMLAAISTLIGQYRALERGPAPGSPINNGTDGGGWRQYLDGIPIHAGAAIDRWQAGRWQLGRYETDYPRRVGLFYWSDASGEHADDIDRAMRFRWPTRD